MEPDAAGPPAEKDVTVTKCTRDSLIGWPHADLRIVNRSGSPAAYIVSITFVDADGTVVSDGVATTEEVAPGASVEVRAQGSGEVAAGDASRREQVGTVDEVLGERGITQAAQLADRADDRQV